MLQRLDSFAVLFMHALQALLLLLYVGLLDLNLGCLCISTVILSLGGSPNCQDTIWRERIHMRLKIQGCSLALMRRR